MAHQHFPPWSREEAAQRGMLIQLRLKVLLQHFREDVVCLSPLQPRQLASFNLKVGFLKPTFI